MTKKTIVISGINGFVGRHLARELHARNSKVIGIGTDPEIAPEISDIVATYFCQDLVTSWPDTGIVDGVIHLAGLAAVGPSFDKPQQYINFNSAMVTNACEYYLSSDEKPRLLIISSGAIYSPHQPLPIKESGEIGLSSPYAVSKVLVENQVTYYRGRGLDCIIARPFNHIGPGQGKGFILPDFYERINTSSENIIKVGNISTKRDYTDVRDIVAAYADIILAQTLSHTIYNVCSGKSFAGIELLDILKQLMNRPDMTFEIDSSLVRPTDIPDIRGDSARIQQELGWSPKHDIRNTIQDYVNHREI